MSFHISIITVTYNCCTTISKTLESVRKIKEEFGPDRVQHVVIDGASSDSTVEIVQSTNVTDLLISEADSGLYNAYNKGLDASSGNFVTFLNGDDYFLDGFIEILEYSLSAEENVLIASNNSIISSGEQVVGVKHSRIEGIYRDMSICFPGLIMPRKSIGKLRFDESMKISADYKFLLELLRFNMNVEILRVNSVAFRLGGVSTLFKNELLRLRENEKARRNLPFNVRMTSLVRDYTFVLSKKCVKWLIS